MDSNTFRKEIKMNIQNRYTGYEKEHNERAEKHFRRHPVTGKEIGVRDHDKE